MLLSHFPVVGRRCVVELKLHCWPQRRARAGKHYSEVYVHSAIPHALLWSLSVLLVYQAFMKSIDLVRRRTQ